MLQPRNSVRKSLVQLAGGSARTLRTSAMILELAEIDVKRGHEADFETAVAQAMHLFLDSKGCNGIRLHRSLEQPTRYRLVVQWKTVDDHMVEFRNSDAFVEWRRLVGPHFAGTPRIEHLIVALDGANQMSPANGLEGSA
jgi:heme-degrading monooxygenase HmoA